MVIPNKFSASQKDETEESTELSGTAAKKSTNALKSYTAISILPENDDSESNQFQLSAPSTFVLLSLPEAESMVESLTAMSIPQIASTEFLTHYAYNVERLNQCAHWSAQMQTGDEFVVDGLVTHKKVTDLIHTLLAVNVWKTRILPAEIESFSEMTEEKDEDEDEEPHPTGETNSKYFLKHLAMNRNSLRVAFTLHVETTLVTLLTLICYHVDNMMELPHEYLISLVDYCARQMTLLASTPIQNNKMVYRQTRNPKSPQDMAKYIQSRSTLMEMQDNILETDYKTAVASVGLAQLLCQHLEYLPLSVQSRILDTHDYAMLFIPLMEEPPWTRRRSTTCATKVIATTTEGVESSTTATIWEKYIGNEWKQVSSSDLLQVTQLEGQGWLSIFSLTCTPCIRERYALTSHRKQQLLRLRKYIHPVIVDQIPVLGNVLAYLDQLTLMDVSQGTISGHGSGGTNGLLLQQVDVVGQELRKGLDWTMVAKNQWRDIFQNVTDATDQDLRLIANVYDGQDDTDELLLGAGGSASSSSPHATTISSLYKEEVEPMAAPLEDITIFLNKSNRSCATLKTNDNTIASVPVIQTPHGPFKRSQLEIQQDKHSEMDNLDYQNMFIEGRISFKGSKNGTPKTLQVNCSLLEDSDSSGPNNSSEIQWVQLGKLEERVVLQLGFKRKNLKDETDKKDSGFVLHQAFFSQPSLQ